MKDLEVCQAPGLFGELFFRPGGTLTEVGGQQCDGLEAEQMDSQIVGDTERELEIGG